MKLVTMTLYIREEARDTDLRRERPGPGLHGACKRVNETAGFRCGGLISTGHYIYLRSERGNRSGSVPSTATQCLRHGRCGHAGQRERGIEK